MLVKRSGTIGRSLATQMANHVNRQLLKPKLVKGTYRILLWMKQFLVKNGDPLITYNLHGYDIALPLSHDLPGILKHWPHYSSNLGRLANYVHQKYADLSFIDIGANVGDSIAILRARSIFPILCVDGDPNFLKVLDLNVQQFDHVEVEPCFIGEVEASASVKSTGVGGTAHLTVVGGTDRIQIKNLDSLLGRHPRFSTSKMIKIDTDGFDCKILRGSANFLRSAKPIIFFEYDPFFLAAQQDDGLSIFPLLRDYGYGGLMIYDNVGDLLLCLPEIDIARLEELHLYFSGRKSVQYCDICVFHGEDQDLFDRSRGLELDFFRQLKG
jgi:FkbM family methyltransferase